MSNLSSNPMTFMILEDDIEMINNFEEFTKNRDDIKLIAKTNSSFEAIKLAKKVKPEAIIVDLELPHGDGTGFEFLTELRNAELNFTPLVIVYTKVKPGMVYDGIHEGYSDLVFYKVKTPIEYLINSMLMSRKNSAQLISETLQDMENKRISELVNAELDAIGLSHKHNGREHIFQSILLMLEKKPKTPREFSPLPYLANQYNMYTSNLTRDVRTAINFAWLNTPVEKLEENYVAPMHMETCMPTPMELIYYYYKKVKELI
ncbi:MAG: response regulator [Oscillospiraceae bacterium]|nr:response regulator [Oscillospiraceae bacterium]